MNKIPWDMPNGRALGHIIERIWRNHPEGAAKGNGKGPINNRGQTWMANQLGVTPATVRRWLRGGARPTPPAMRLMERLETEAGLGE